MLKPKLETLWDLSETKIRRIYETYPRERGTPVFTVDGQYTSRGWTEWTQGFFYGWGILQFDSRGSTDLLQTARVGTVKHMATHVSHIGVHDHGFNNVSTYGNLRRLMLEERIQYNEWELGFYELALKVSGAVQGSRWGLTDDRTGYVYSFNGPQSLFVDTIRSMRSLVLSHALGHKLMGEGDEQISLLRRAFEHIANTVRYNIFFGENRDAYDTVPGRVAHESIFNPRDGQFRCSSTQQGYSAFSTWTRGLAWALTGLSEQLEFLDVVPGTDAQEVREQESLRELMLSAACATADFYIDMTPTDGIPYWDTAAPGLAGLDDYRNLPSDPYNHAEPVDSSAAAIAAQGLLRLGRLLSTRGDTRGSRYTGAGVVVMNSLLDEPYLSTDHDHQGLLLHGVYHRPRAWDHEPGHDGVPRGESVLWGDYHLVEAALLAQRLADDGPYYTFFGPRDSLSFE